MVTDDLLEQLEETENSWEINAGSDKFYGFSLPQYKAEVQLSRDARDLVANCVQQLKAARNNKKDIDKKNRKLEHNIAKAIAGDPNYGDDSALYEGTGRVRSSERRSGLKRPRKSANNGG